MRVLHAAARTLPAWYRHQLSGHGAALAFYGLFAVAPVLLVVSVVGTHLLGADAARAQLSEQLRLWMTPDVAATVEQMLVRAARARTGLAVGVAGAVVMIYGGMRALFQLQATMDLIWARPTAVASGWWGFVRGRLLAVGSVALCALLVIVSMLASMVAQESTAHHLGQLPGAWIVRSASAEISTFFSMFVLAVIVYRTLSPAATAWRDVVFGGLLTAALFVFGKQVMEWYLREIAITSVFGAAGALVAFMLYAYYSAQVLLLGAQFTYLLGCNGGAHKETVG